MDGAGFIELPGAANPLTVEHLCRALQSATSANHSQRRSAEEQLKTWEQAQGFLPSLQTVFLEKSLPLELRLQAIIQLKNNIDGRWRLMPHIKNALPPEEKQLIRSRLYDGTINEEARLLALHNSLVVAKIVRIDYPQAWPDALSDLATLVRTYRTDNHQHLKGALQLLFRIIKEMASMRLRRAQSTFQEIAPKLTHLVAEVYAENVSLWMNLFASGRRVEEDSDLAMMNSLLALKTVRLLLLAGFDKPHHDKTVRAFWTLVQTHFGQLLGFISHDDSKAPAPFQTEVGNHLLQYTKLHVNMCRSHPVSFTALPDSIPLVHAYWDLVSRFAEVYDQSEGIRVLSGAASSSLSHAARSGSPPASFQSVSADTQAKAKVHGPLLERLALRGLVLIRACAGIALHPIQTFKYRPVEVKEEQKKATEFIKKELFGPDLVVQMTNILISRLFVFRKSDLDAWEESPEEWEQQEQSESTAYEWEVRPCAEKLFLDLLPHYGNQLIPPLLEYFASVADERSDVATKEAVYTALGLAAPFVHPYYDFDELLASTLVRDVQQQGPLHKVLRRRIAILTSDWVGVKVSDHSRQLIYQLFRHLLNPADPINDEVVRFTAARQLKWIVDELDFQPELFLPLVPEILRWMIDLIENSEIDETKLAILESIRLIVLRMENHVSQFGDYIMSTMPQVWAQTGPEDFMIKQAIVAIFSALVLSMGEAAQRYHHFMIPLITEAATPGTSLHANLVDEVLEMWANVLMFSSPPLSRELIGVVHLALQNLDSTSSTVSFALGVVESYILLAPSEMLSDSLRGPTTTALASIVLESKGRELVMTGTSCVEYLIRLAKELGGSDGVSVVLREMMDSRFLPKIMERLHGAWEAHQTTGPNRKVSTLNVVTEGDYFAILARISLADPTLLVDMLGSFGSLDQVWDWLSQEWFSFATDCDIIERQKLYLLGLTRLFELSAPMQDLVLVKLHDYFSMWTGVIMELLDGIADAQDSLIWGPNEPAEDPLEDDATFKTPRAEREKEVTRADPIHTVNALGFVRERLGNIIQRLGGEERFRSEWVVNVEDVVAEKFWSLARG